MLIDTDYLTVTKFLFISAKEKLRSSAELYGIRRRPTLPDRYLSSTIGTEELNFCVRYGNRWDPFVIATGNGELCCFAHPDNCTVSDSVF